MVEDDRDSIDLERDGNGRGSSKRTPTDSCPSDTDSCPSDTDSCPSDSEDEEQGELPEMIKFEPKPQPLQRRRSSIQKMIDVLMEKEDEVRVRAHASRVT